MTDLIKALLQIATALILVLTIVPVIATPFIVYRLWKKARAVNAQNERDYQDLKKRNSEFRQRIGLP